MQVENIKWALAGRRAPFAGEILITQIALLTTATHVIIAHANRPMTVDLSD
jgi:hypothetical protein